MEILSNTLILIRGFACLSAGIGLIRFEDFYQRLHAISKSATLGVFLIYSAAILATPGMDRLPVLILVLVFMAFSTPLSTHLMATAALKCKLPLGSKDASLDSTGITKDLRKDEDSNDHSGDRKFLKLSK